MNLNSHGVRLLIILANKDENTSVIKILFHSWSIPFSNQKEI